ncbi:MFS transporter [Clostridium estertheticum]|uniref:MFS transporter n=1 Tax=Clostridium estertheticum TaxID=238834 RepID=A0AA47I5B9_9CLOT|nr:MFS transporter [Clostridium estertheticum]MBU3154846.1 MFS transporter [Clostridium estertheticum]MBU3200459.1 MFS transporter [Clostridium estertheticum]WAG58675.1 MFS transporter [Clostridium estertheticum]WAG67287.1 MFS transporter [Clostridium estertheticum]
MSSNEKQIISKEENKLAWKTTISASMANYIDAGSIVAGAAGLSLWTSYLHMSDAKLGLLSALSSNAVSAAIGALIGGYICDKYGRKLVYNFSMIFYMFGMLFIIFSQNFGMMLTGYIIVGLSVGADIPASWTTIAEGAPAKERAKHCGTAQLAWAAGPVIVMILSVSLGHLGLLGSRIVFGHLFVVALVTWLIRRTLPESQSWLDQKKKEKQLIAKGQLKKVTIKDLLRPVNFKSIIFLLGVYLFWNLAAGTMGFFMPLIYQTVGKVSAETANLLQAGLFACTAIGTYFVFMRLGDKVSRRGIYAVSAIMAIGAWSIFLLPASSMKPSMLLIFVVGYGLSCGFGQQPFYQLWASELFPTKYRASAQGVMFFVVRIALGIWSFVIPTIMSKFGFQLAAACMIGFLVISAIVGIAFAPNTSGRTLDDIEKERYGSIS